MKGISTNLKGLSTAQQDIIGKFITEIIGIADPLLAVKNNIRYIPPILSIHGKESSHDALTRVPGSYWQAVQGIRNVVSLGCVVLTDTVLNSANIAEIDSVVAFLVSLGVSVCQVDCVIPSGMALELGKDIVPSLEEMALSLKKLIGIARIGRAGERRTRNSRT